MICQTNYFNSLEMGSICCIGIANDSAGLIPATSVDRPFFLLLGMTVKTIDPTFDD